MFDTNTSFWKPLILVLEYKDKTIMSVHSMKIDRRLVDMTLNSPWFELVKSVQKSMKDAGERRRIHRYKKEMLFAYLIA